MTNDDETLKPNRIVSEISKEGQLKMEVIQFLAEPCDRKTYSERLREAAKRLDCSLRTVQRLTKKWEEDGLSAFTSEGRADKGQHRTDQTWTEFIITTYKEGNKNSKRITPAQVAMKVKVRAHKLGLETFPSHMTVYRILNPLIESQENSKKARSIGWKGSRLSLKTKDGQSLSVEYSNQVWQCDHTLADILLVDHHGELVGRPWLTTVIDSYSRCIIGINLGFDAPSSQVVALALRHAMLPKVYSADYKLNCKWGTEGKPDYLFTDNGKDFRSNHAQQIATQLGFVWHYRDRPSEGGIVERPFGTFNTQFFSTLLGYTGSNVQKRPENAEKNASLTLLELEIRLVRYIVDHYNQSIDARMSNQTRFQRWESGLIATPNLLSERELDICLMKQTRRKIYRGGYVQFENLTYRGENLSGYAGESVILRYDPRDITTVFVYHLEGSKDVFLARAFAQNLEAERIGLDEVKASSRRLRQKGKTLNNRSILEEVSDRQIFEDRKRSRKQVKKNEQALISTQPASVLSETVEETVLESPLFRERPKYDLAQLRNDYGW
ncbi:Mu transposase C-terminal domain-containing protein [Phormidium tenue]|uniref:Mu transposase C-terminal domain-containing protein n=1 Tax=Phormidium tenue FACHB-1050 TaxID=2692857 RepID=A0ABR8CHE4_9CYAN|nr:Mu transposase C-terminal domain-containing protein [Phormidium tenue]MBD2319470.1 Mu transposase C-terminal domain-containing protein [Phormidium tenue FACHB-1050]